MKYDSFRKQKYMLALQRSWKHKNALFMRIAKEEISHLPTLIRLGLSIYLEIRMEGSREHKEMGIYLHFLAVLTTIFMFLSAYAPAFIF